METTKESTTNRIGNRTDNSFLLQMLANQLKPVEDEEKVLYEIRDQLVRIADSLEEMAAPDGKETKPTYTVKETGELLGKSPSTIRRWIRKGKLKSTKSSDNNQGQHLITRGSIQTYL